MGKVIVGLGETGFSCAKYFARQGIDFSVMDDNPAPERLAFLRDLDSRVTFSAIDVNKLLNAEEIIVSPGVPLSLPALVQARESGIPVTGDVAMFGELAKAPVVAITGSNGKSTVTAMFGYLAAYQQTGVVVGGNIGTPCLDLLSDDSSLYVLEVSSYQLELATSLPAAVSVVLNLAPDHLDRYGSPAEYYGVKGNIYRNCSVAVINRDTDFPLPIIGEAKVMSFGSDEPGAEGEFGLVTDGGKRYIACGSQKLIAINELPLEGSHNVLNVMATLALGCAIDLDMKKMLAAIKGFKGLAHRCELIATVNGVRYYNDSKATNVASTVSALTSFGKTSRNLVHILGGVGKNADFSPLQDVAGRFVKQAIVIGRDQQLILDTLADSCPCVACDTLEEAVKIARETANSGEIVMFSPACASFDMFEDYKARGDTFRSLVSELSR